MKVPSFIPSFPEELDDCRQFTADEFRKCFPFVEQMVRTALTHDFRGSHQLTFAQRLSLPFLHRGAIWSFRFVNSTDSVEETDEMMFDVNDTLMPIDATDATFFGALRKGRWNKARRADTATRAYLAVRYAVSGTLRAQKSLVWFPSLTQPDGIDDTKWKTALDKAAEFLVDVRQQAPDLPDGDVYAILNRRAGTVTLSTIEPEYQSLILSDPILVKGEDVGTHWSIAVNPMLHLVSSDRAAERVAKGRIAIRNVEQWRPEGFDGDADLVLRRSHDAYRERRRNWRWEQVFPQDRGAGGTPGRALRETGELFRTIRDRCGDYEIPTDCIDYCDAPRNVSSAPLVVLRRAVPFYPGHLLYRIVDRRGGAPRQTQVLFAPADAVIPAGIDRLIPLNDSAMTLHMLNDAYAVRLAGIEAIEYVDFFCDSVSGEGRVFHIIESIDDVRWQGNAAKQRALLEKVVKPIRLWSGGDGVMVLDGLLSFATFLYHAEFTLAPQGDLKMSDDHFIMSGLEIAPEFLSARTHCFLRPPLGYVVPDPWSR